jgi:hypothetical protein
MILTGLQPANQTRAKSSFPLAMDLHVLGYLWGRVRA